jgi:hypothetical protein
MMKVILLIAVIALFCEGDGKSIRTTNGNVKTLNFSLKDDPTDANALVDEILDIVNLEIESLGLDPYYADLDVLDLFNVQGNLSGLASLARSGDAQMETEGFDLIITTDVSITNMDGELAIISDWFPELEASAGVDIKDIVVDLKIKATLPFGPFKLKEFTTSDIGEISVTITGLGLLDPLVDDVADLIANAVKDLVADLLDTVVKDILNDILENL